MDAAVDPSGDSLMLLQCLLEPVTSPVLPLQQSPRTPTFTTVPHSNSGLTNAKLSTEDRPWICEQCGFPFKYKNNLAEHMRFYHMKGSVPCNKCSRVFPTSTHLRQHRKDHAVEQGRCPHCRCTFPGTNNNPELYNELYQKHLPECRRCPARRSATKKPKVPLQVIHPKASENNTESTNYVLSCLLCGRKFSDLVDYETHRCSRPRTTIDEGNILDTEHGKEVDSMPQTYPLIPLSTYESSFTQSASSDIDFNCLCIICGVNFDSEEKLNLHLYENHQTCDQDSVNQNLNDSSTSSSSNEPTVSCNTCSEKFSDNSVLEKHQVRCRIKAGIRKTEVKNTNVTEDVAKCVEDSDSDVVLCWLCKHCRQVFSDRSTMESHRKECDKKEVSVRPVATESEVEVNDDDDEDDDDMPGTVELTSLHKTSDFETSKSPVEVRASFLVASDSDVVEEKSDFVEPDSSVNKSNPNLAVRDPNFLPNTSNLAEPDFKVIQNASTSTPPTSDAKQSTSDFSTQGMTTVPQVADYGLHVSQEAPSFFCSANYNIGDSKMTDQQTNSEQESITGDSELIIHWLCKYCKNPFPTKKEMRTHKEICALEHRSFQRRGVLVRWVCKYCKQDFESRECMQSHKKMCSQSNKDKSIMSSTESDISEVVSKESTLNGSVNVSMESPSKLTVIDVDHKQVPEKLANSVNFINSHLDIKINDNITSNNETGTVKVTESASDNEEVKQGIFVHHYNLNDIQHKQNHNSVILVHDDNRIDHNNLNNSNNNNNIEEECNLFDVPDESEDTLVKWVCKYCKNVFDDREEMSTHKKTCALKTQRKNEISSGLSKKSKLIANGMSHTKAEIDRIDTITCTPTMLDQKETTSEQQCKARPKLKLKIKLRHSCNICGEKFTVRKLLRAHRLDSHMFKCFRCGRYFSNNSLLWKHARLCRTQKTSPENRKHAVYSCKRCYRVFRERYRYKLHKGSCQHQKLEPENENLCSTISLPHEKILLRIHCHKCSGMYVGGEVIKLHTCEKPRDIDAFLCCQICMTSFSSIPEFCRHSLECALDLPGVSTESVPSRIVCHTCLRQFDSIYFFYQHLITGICCDDFFKDCLQAANSSYYYKERAETSDLSSSSSEDNESTDDDNDGDWTCTYCTYIFPSSIPKLTHYQMCRKQDLFSTELLTKIENLPKTCKIPNLTLPTVKVVLQRLPKHLLAQYSKPRTPEPEINVADLNLTKTSIQRCVICFKKCRFAGTRLPPIGQLECFRCREKNHRKELKKRGEQFYCRSVFDDEVDLPPADDQNTYCYGYLDPSKRLKISRALFKVKHSSQEKEGETEASLSTRTVTQVVAPSNNSMMRIVRKCSHCKRGFANKEQLEKHVKLSKTCLLAEKARLKLTSELMDTAATSYQMGTSIEPRSSIINFMDFFSNAPCTMSMNQGGVVSISSETISPNSETQDLNSCFRAEMDNYSSLDNEHSNSDHSEVSVSTGSDRNLDTMDVSSVLQKEPSQKSSRTQFLLLESVDKVLKSSSVTKRVPTSPALQCDGWILKSTSQMAENGSCKIKLICGACYKSFRDAIAFQDHVSTVHKLSADISKQLNVMKHIPEELLNKVTW